MATPSRIGTGGPSISTRSAEKRAANHKSEVDALKKKVDAATQQAAAEVDRLTKKAVAEFAKLKKAVTKSQKKGAKKAAKKG